MNKVYRIFATYIVLFWIPTLYAQPDLSDKISLQLSDVSLEEAVKALKTVDMDLYRIAEIFFG
jgi:hypothetical protein